MYTSSTMTMGSALFLFKDRSFVGSCFHLMGPMRQTPVLFRSFDGTSRANAPLCLRFPIAIPARGREGAALFSKCSSPRAFLVPFNEVSRFRECLF